jgi:hypothetical protein
MNLGRMKIDIPDTWEDRSTYTFIAPRTKANIGPVAAADDGFRTNLVVTTGKAGQARALDEVLKTTIEQLRANFGDIPYEQTAGPEISGQPSQRVTYRIIEPGGTLPIVQVQYLTTANKTERIFTFTTAAVHAKSLAPELDRMMRSIQLDVSTGG